MDITTVCLTVLHYVLFGTDEHQELYASFLGREELSFAESLSPMDATIELRRRYPRSERSKPVTRFSHNADTRKAPKPSADRPYAGSTPGLDLRIVTNGCAKDNRHVAHPRQRCGCGVCLSCDPFDYESTRSRAEVKRAAINEGLEAMRIDTVDDEATEGMLANVDFARAMVSTSLTRAEAAWLGERIVYDARHFDTHTSCAHCRGEWFPTVPDLAPQYAVTDRVTQRVEANELAKRTGDVRDFMGAHEVLVLDDQDEMLPEDVIIAHAWDVCDYTGY